MRYKPRGICATEINFVVVNDKVYNVSFVNGCPGNHLGIAALVEGMPVDEVINRLSGIGCGGRPTSCPDQLAEALKEYKKGGLQ